MISAFGLTVVYISQGGFQKQAVFSLHQGNTWCLFCLTKWQKENIISFHSLTSKNVWIMHGWRDRWCILPSLCCINSLVHGFWLVLGWPNWVNQERWQGEPCQHVLPFLQNCDLTAKQTSVWMQLSSPSTSMSVGWQVNPFVSTRRLHSWGVGMSRRLPPR